MINYACRRSDGSLRPTSNGGCKMLYCPRCQFEYKKEGCLFTPNHMATFGEQVRQSKPRGAASTNNLTGGRWTLEGILEVIVEYYQKRGEWPCSTMAFRDSERLPHSSTVVRHFGSIEQAVEQAQRYAKVGEVGP